MKIILTLFLTLMSFGAVALCPLYFADENKCASLEWTDGPVLNANSSFRVFFWEKGDADHSYVSPEQSVEMKTWMIMANGHSHGGPTITWDEVENGVFEVADAKFFMGGMNGHWQVKVIVGEEEQSVNVEF